MMGYAFRESLRRRVFLVVLVLTAAFLGLYALGAKEAFDSVEAQRAGEVFDVDQRELTGATMFGLSMFGTLFLGAVLAAFLTLGTVRGDAERGLLQPDEGAVAGTAGEVVHTGRCSRAASRRRLRSAPSTSSSSSSARSSSPAPSAAGRRTGSLDRRCSSRLRRR